MDQNHGPLHRATQEVVRVIGVCRPKLGHVSQLQPQPVAVAEAAVVGAEVAPVTSACGASSEPRGGTRHPHRDQAALLPHPNPCLHGGLLQGLLLLCLQKLSKPLIEAVRVPLAGSVECRDPLSHSIREGGQRLLPMGGKELLGAGGRDSSGEGLQYRGEAATGGAQVAQRRKSLSPR
jgi:hypothetical protein